MENKTFRKPTLAESIIVALALFIPITNVHAPWLGMERD